MECGSGEMSFQRKQGFQNLDIQGHRPENREQSREKPYVLVKYLQARKYDLNVVSVDVV